MKKKLLFLLISFGLVTVSEGLVVVSEGVVRVSDASQELLYTGKEFELTVPAYDVVTVEVPCEVTAKAYPKEKLQLKTVKAGDRTLVYLLPKEEKASLSLSCVDRTYTFKLNPIDTKSKKKLECKNGKCQIVEEKPKMDFSKLETHYIIVDPTIVKEETKKAEANFSSKEQIVDEAVKLMSAMVTDRKLLGYVVRRKSLNYYLTPDISVSLQKFYKGLLYGQVVELKNNSYFPVSFDIKKLDGTGNVLLYSPSMDKEGVIHFAPGGEAVLYVVQVRKGLKLPYVQVESSAETGKGSKDNLKVRLIPVKGLSK